MPELTIGCSKSGGKIMYAFKQKMERPGSGLTLIGPFKQLGPGLKFIRGLALIGFPITGSCNTFLPGI